LWVFLLPLDRAAMLVALSMTYCHYFSSSGGDTRAF
jgi:hypothetical protein